MRTINKIVIHHSATPPMSLDEANKRFRYEHMHLRGWKDIGYHYLVDAEGNMLKTHRPDSVVGAHAGASGNPGSLGVCVIGNYESSRAAGGLNHKPSDIMICRLSMHMAELCFKYSIDTSNIFGHRNYMSTACPGDNLYAKLSTIRSKAHFMKLEKLNK